MAGEMGFFADRVWYCKRRNEIFIGGPDWKQGGKPWTWFITNEHEIMRPTGTDKIPKSFVLIDKQWEKTLLRENNSRKDKPQPTQKGDE